MNRVQERFQTFVGLAALALAAVFMGTAFSAESSANTPLDFINPHSTMHPTELFVVGTIMAASSTTLLALTNFISRTDKLATQARELGVE